MADRLNGLAVLDLHPPGSTLQDRSSGCDDDAVYASASRQYSPAAGTDVVAFYRDALPAKGWVPEVSEQPGHNPVCFTRKVAGTDAYLTVWFLSDFGEKADDFVLQVDASYQEGASC